ncbi:MAG: pilus assembly protein PilM [Lentisphaerae bacterium]|nr:pilus assembly protein PilM [Lentisphaerota bacterium]
MSASWCTGVCVRRNRLEWTVLRWAKNAWDVHSHGAADLPGAPGEEGVATALRAEARAFRGRVSMALPGETVLLRVGLLPSTDPDELRGMVELQMDKYSPFPVESMSFGAGTLESTETASLVTMAAVRNEIVETWGRCFQEAGAAPDLVDVELLGWWWVLKDGGKVPARGTQIFLRQDGRDLDMILARDGAPLLFRSLPQRPEPDGEGAIAAWMGECIEETGFSLTSLETEWGEVPAPTLHVFHALGEGVEWAERFKSALSLESARIHSLEEVAPVSEGIARRAAEPTEPLALDLAPAEWREGEVARAARRRLWRSATIFLVAWLLGSGLFISLLNVRQGRLDRLQNEVEALEGPAREIRRLRGKVLEFSLYADRTYSALESLRVLSENMPEGMDLSSFVYRKGSTLTLRGESDSSERVYGFIKTLEDVGYFPEVKIESVNVRQTPQGQRSQFNVTIRLPGTGEESS